MKALTFIFLFLAFTVKGQIIYVHPDSLHSTVQSGINAATDGDTVLVADGIYHEQISFLGKAITVASNYIMDGDPAHIDNTVLDGSLLDIYNGSVVLFTSGEDTTSIINGFTIQNGKGTSDGIYLVGGGIYISNSGAKILNNKIANNSLDGTAPEERCTGGAGIATKVISSNHWLIIINNTIDSNQCISHSYDAAGAAIISFMNTRIENNIITHNLDSSDGSYGRPFASIFIECLEEQPDNQLIAVNNIIQNNTSITTFNEVRGAGMWCAQLNAIITGNDISYNKTSSTFQGYGGAGIHIKKPVSTLIENNLISYNTSSSNGGGIFLTEYDSFTQPPIIRNNMFIGNQSEKGGGLASEIDLNLSNNVFEDNTSTEIGGALHLFGNSVGITSVENNTFIGNQAPKGGAFSGSNANVMLTNNVFRYNSATSLHGGAIYVFKAGDPTTNTRIINNSFSENTSIELGGAIYSWGCNPIIMNSIFWENNASIADEIMANLGNASVAYSNIDPEGIDGEVNLLDGNMFHDPLFCSTYCLMPDSTSPCLNVGTEQYVFPGQDTLNAPLQDILGRTRPINDAYDMGAYEVDTVYVGISKLESQLQFKLYPNPFSHRLYCTYNLPEQAIVEVIIYDMVGRIMTTLQERQLSGFYNIPVKTDKLTKGIYLFVLKIDGMAVSRKIIKQ